MSNQPHASIPQWTRGDRLGKALHHAGVSVQEMAEYLGVSRNTIGNYLADRTHISGPALRLWALRTGVPMSWIETGIAPGEGPDGPDELPRLDSNQQPFGYRPVARITPGLASAA